MPDPPAADWKASALASPSRSRFAIARPKHAKAGTGFSGDIGSGRRAPRSAVAVSSSRNLFDDLIQLSLPTET